MQPAAKPTRVGPYKLGKTLGIGSFCKVKLAVHELTGQKVAIKILNRKKLKAMDMGEKVRTEIHILRMFTHPHIIRLYEVIDTPNDIYSVMEYVPGGELFDYIVSRGKLDEKEARSLIQQIVSGVEYCHVHMVVHRDLKPENLLLDADNKIKIADFGLSSRMKDGQLLKTSCGSPNYAAPEVISGNLYAGPEVDVWSIGVIMYAILCGSLPFDDENIRNLFRKIKGGIYTIPSYVSAPARDLLHKMLVVDPLKRITVPQIMQHPWYCQNLPAYLALSAEQQIERTHAVDEATLQKVVNMGFQKDRVLKALSLGAELLTSRKMAHLTDARYVAVVYNLMLDQKRKKERAGEENKFADSTPEVKTSSDAVIVYNANTPDPSSTIMDPTMSAIAMSTYKAVEALHVQEQNRSLSHPPRWHLGSFCRDDPQTIMNAVYRALKALNFEWKVLSLYKLKCRYPSGLSSTSPDQPISSSDVCKIGIQLYKTPRNVHVLDMSKLYGQMFLFLDLCGHLMSELGGSVLIRS